MVFLPARKEFRASHQIHTIVNDIVLVKNLVLDLCRNGFYRKRKVAAEVPAQLQMDNKHKGGDTILSEMISIKWTPPTTLKS